MIEDLLRSGRPAMVGRFGCTEMSCLHNYLEIGKAGRNPLNYITGRRDQWWWNKKHHEADEGVVRLFPGRAGVSGPFLRG